MELKILKDEKEELEVELENITLAEILRVYLNKDADVSFAAWKREHPTKKPVLNVKGKNPKKAVKEGVASIVKDLARDIKERFKDTLLIIGGVHPTIDSHDPVSWGADISARSCF